MHNLKGDLLQFQVPMCKFKFLINLNITHLDNCEYLFLL